MPDPDEERAARAARTVEEVVRDALAYAWEQGWRARSEAESRGTVIPRNPYGLGYRKEPGDA